jgi:hypothetical protein
VVYITQKQIKVHQESEMSNKLRAAFTANAEQFDGLVVEMLAENERLKKENAELKQKHANLIKELSWRLEDIRDDLMSTGVGGSRIYGCDEWSTPVVNLKSAIGLLK